MNATVMIFMDWDDMILVLTIRRVLEGIREKNK